MTEIEQDLAVVVPAPPFAGGSPGHCLFGACPSRIVVRFTILGMLSLRRVSWDACERHRDPVRAVIENALGRADHEGNVTLIEEDPHAIQ